MNIQKYRQIQIALEHAEERAVSFHIKNDILF